MSDNALPNAAESRPVGDRLSPWIIRRGDRSPAVELYSDLRAIVGGTAAKWVERTARRTTAGADLCAFREPRHRNEPLDDGDEPSFARETSQTVPREVAGT